MARERPMATTDYDSLPAKTIVTRTKSTEWFGSDYNMNIYRGCCHGCIYCDSRSECYGDPDFDRVKVKENALTVIRDDLRRKVKTGVVATGAMSDPYNPLEETLELTRHALELIDAYGFGAAVATKSDLIVRDTDVLTGIITHSPVIVKITITTVDDGLAARIEPGAPSSMRRFAAVQKLAKHGIFTGILMMPLLPFINDTKENVSGIVRTAADAGARFVYPAFGVTLRDNQRMWYYNRLEESFAGDNLADRYRRRFADKYRCASPQAHELWNVFTQQCDACGLLYHMSDIIRAYKLGYDQPQLSMF